MYRPKEVCSLLNRGRLTTTGQAAVYQANLSMPSTSQECPKNSPCVQSPPVNKKGPKTQDVGIARLYLKLHEVPDII